MVENRIEAGSGTRFRLSFEADGDALPDRILVFGGEAPLRIFNATEMWETAGQRWIAKEPMPTPRHGIGAVVIDGRVFVPAGGTQPGFAASAANEVYTP